MRLKRITLVFRIFVPEAKTGPAMAVLGATALSGVIWYGLLVNLAPVS